MVRFMDVTHAWKLIYTEQPCANGFWKVRFRSLDRKSESEPYEMWFFGYTGLYIGHMT
jgi:hypothetical protein